jgi:hypothetical protein
MDHQTFGTTVAREQVGLDEADQPPRDYDALPPAHQHCELVA